MNIKIDQLIRSKRRSIGLEINDKAELIIRAPRHVSIKQIENVVELRRNWIEQKQIFVREKFSNYKPKNFTENEEFLYLGKSYKLFMVKDEKEKFYFNDAFFLAGKWRVKAKALFIYWYKQEAKRIIRERVKHFAGLYEFKYNHIKITNAKKRWGSCTGKNNLNFTWRLVLAPLEIIDSVVVHELVHTRTKNHSKKFWSDVFKIMPEYPRHNQWLKENGYLLNLD
jgi:predicted metal-dependent hydrolase